ncbi:MAG TPA: zinc-dependent alcohol dehydrogenase family protein [Verrucomicrobiae bacterium]|nr:zinc-dependent alcohol dehydrogenase family protein [Verrucomicrobiae bacterium]
MNAQLLREPRPAEESPLEVTDLPVPLPGDDELLIHVHACGVCHTDLHTVEGEISAKLPVVPGHQIVGVVEKVGGNVKGFRIGDRVGVPWLHQTCGECEFCRSDRENLCDRAEFTGFHVNGGYAEYATALAAFAVKIPDNFDDVHAAPLLCAGIIGFRALRLSNVHPQQTLGLYGFGASAHIAIQIAARWGCEVYVATRGKEHQRLAKELGATWVGRAEDLPDSTLHSAVMFAPAGSLVPEALRALRKGGTLALAGIYMTPIPELNYERLYHERIVRSVANATRDDAWQLMQLAGQIPLRAEVQTFPLADANRTLAALKHGKIGGAGVLIVDG